VRGSDTTHLVQRLARMTTAGRDWDLR